uniref:Uncharacterized protein n=1 Tax=Physcomitrium patens TaxID=3218 RepID=A0A7I4FAM4_PHYPA
MQGTPSLNHRFRFHFRNNEDCRQAPPTVQDYVQLLHQGCDLRLLRERQRQRARGRERETDAHCLQLGEVKGGLLDPLPLKRVLAMEESGTEYLLPLQRNWKVKRQRGVAAGPGGSAEFSIGVRTSESAPCLEQNSVGLLTAHLPAALTLSSLHVTLHSTPAPFKFRNDTGRLSATSKEGKTDATVLPEASEPGERGVGPGVDRGATRT